MASTIVKTSLPEYVNANNDELLVKSMLGAKTLDYIEIMTDVKHKSALNYLDSTVVFGDGSECGFNAQGNDTLTQRYIEVMPIKINKEWCDRDLLSTFANHQNLIEAGRETMPFEQRFVEANLAAIKAKLEDVIWKGDSALDIDGFLAQLGAEAGVIDVSAASIEPLVDAVYEAIPESVMDKDVHIFMGTTEFRQYVKLLNDNCCGNQPIIDVASGEMSYVGDSRVKIVAVPGLNGTNKVVAGARDNFVYGTDVNGSEATYKLWYSDDADLFRFKVLFNAGTQIKFPSDAVLGVIA